MVAIHAVHYNFARIHKTLRITPSMAAGLTDHVWSLEEIVMMADSYMPQPGTRPLQKESWSGLMSRLWRLASGLAVLLMALFFSASLVMNLLIGERPLPGFAYRVLLPIAACVVIVLSCVGSYILLNDTRHSK